MDPQPGTAGSRRRFALGPVAMMAAALVACGGDDDGGGGGGSAATGSLTLAVTDAPVDEADNVFVQFSSVTLQPSGDDPLGDIGGGDGPLGGDTPGDDTSGDNGDGDDGLGASDTPAAETIEFDEPERIDLLAQRNGASAPLLEDERIPAGQYDWIRLGVDLGIGESVIVIRGQQFDLDIPSGAETGLQIADRFTVPEGGSLDLTIDFDLRRSVVEAPPGSGEFMLRPALRLVRTDDAGRIDARATSGFVNDRCPEGNDAQAIYVFAGDDVTPDDVDTSSEADVDPVTTASLALDDATGDFVGTAGFLRPGTYTVAFTCDPENDLPDSDEGNADVAGDVFLQDTTTVEVERRGAASLGLEL